VLTVRRFRCPNPQCRRQVVAEPFGPTLPRYARRTAEVTEVLRVLAQAAGGEVGAGMAEAVGLPTSPATLLRLLRQGAAAVGPTPRVLGVDDLALRRRHRYATILVDLETHRPVDLLDDRTAETLATWLRAHPGVEVVVRDRAEAYAEGARAGAPDAHQVADRFHLLQNASAALEEVLRCRRRRVDYVTATAASETAAVPATGDAGAAATAAILPPAPAAAPPDAPPLSPTQQRQAARRAARVARWERVRALHAAGTSQREIARELGMSRMTVRRLLAPPVPPRNQPPARPRPGGLTSPTLQPFVVDLQDRWQAGCENVSQLYREVAARGYTGSRSLLHQALLPWREPRPLPAAGTRRRRGRPRARRFRVRWLCLRPLDQLDDEERAALDRLLAEDADLATGHGLLQRFRQVVAERDVGALAAWLTDAAASGLAPFASLANGIVADRAAVEAALSTPWSNGPVEGHVTRVKLLKRQHYGRATLDLLRRRVLAA
jgi:transposase